MGVSARRPAAAAPAPKRASRDQIMALRAEVRKCEDRLGKLNDMRDTSPPPLEEVRGEIENQLRQEALQARIAELRSGAAIEMSETEVPPAAIRETDLLSD